MKKQVKNITCKSAIIGMILPIILAVKYENKIDKYFTIDYKDVKSLDDLKLYFDSDITIDNVFESLANNKNINDEYREYTVEFLNLLNKEFPNINLTVINENIKKFNIKEITKEEMKKKGDRAAYYNIEETTIYMQNDYEIFQNKKIFYFHELWHMFNNLWIMKDNTIYVKTTKNDNEVRTAFDEGMTTYLSNRLYKTSNKSYINEKNIIEVLEYIIGSDLIDMYLNYGVEGVERLLSIRNDSKNVSRLIELMSNELNGDLENPIEIFEIIFDIYKNSDKFDYKNHEKLYNILSNLNYSNEIVKEIMLLFKKTIQNFELTNQTLVTFNNVDYYYLDELYFIKCNEEYYLVNDEILINFFTNKTIRNIYDLEEKTISNGIIYNHVLLRDYLNYCDKYINVLEDGSVYIDILDIEDVKYVKSYKC